MMPGPGAEITVGPPSALRWRPSPLLRRLTAVSVLALCLAAALGRAELVLVAAPLLWWLASADRALPTDVRVGTRGDPDRCQEGEEVTVSCVVRFDGLVNISSAVLPLPAGLELLHAPELPACAVDRATLTWRLRAVRWGRRRTGSLSLAVRGPGGLCLAIVNGPVAEVIVLPAPAAADAVLLPAELPRRVGEHPVASPGSGLEFEGLRPYRPGDRPRQVNWAVSARRGELFVTTRQDERSFDLIVLIDAFLRVGPFGHDSLDLSVRGASGLARAHLRHGERVGVVAVGGSLRGLAPGVGAHQFHRVAEAVLDVRLNDSFVDPDVNTLPPTVLPHGALTVFFSPLLDERARLTARELRRTGHPLTVVDVLNTAPHTARRSSLDSTAVRLWRLDRAADRWELRQSGVPVVLWDELVPLSAALRPMRGHPIPGRWP
ncbi:DUF58 domain-containing protein [Actinacidiphila alni]|uniref:DUF58 domain-containing protein n=1 Tax=Actinacidiphila alni TaxID=380248 RepID=UPI0034523EF8